jgi:hypothetical protein
MINGLQVSIHEKVVSVVMEINGSNVIDQLSSNQKSSKLRSYSFDMPPQEDNTEVCQYITCCKCLTMCDCV